MAPTNQRPPNVRRFNKLLAEAYILLEQGNQAIGKAKSLSGEMGGW